jgi:hypothetical protein
MGEEQGSPQRNDRIARAAEVELTDDQFRTLTSPLCIVLLSLEAWVSGRCCAVIGARRG